MVFACFKALKDFPVHERKIVDFIKRKTFRAFKKLVLRLHGDQTEPVGVQTNRLKLSFYSSCLEK